MKISTVFLLGLVYSSSTFADGGDEGVNDSIYKQLQSSYVSSEAPSKAETLGWWSGRCYRKSSPDEPYATLMVSRNIEIKGLVDNGPLFPSVPSVEKHQMIFIISGDQDSSKADHFDSNSEEIQESIEEVLNRFENEQSIVVIKENAFVAKTNRNIYMLRVHQDYFVGRANIFSQGSLSDNCYFFKKVFSY